jgi:glutathione S-transferase
VTIELLQFRYSPFSEKVRWALDFKRVPHTRRSLLPGPHAGTVKRLTGRSGTPVLVVDGEALDGSARILERLEERFPEPALYPADPAERKEALRLEQWFDDDIAPRGRRAVLAALLETPGYFARVFADGRWRLVQLGYALVVPLAANLVRKGNGISGPESIADGVAAFEHGLEFVAARAGTSGYLVGARFSVADVAAAAALATCVDPPASPMARPQPMSAPFRAFLDRFAKHPGADWVRAIYAKHRGAAADFDGEKAY